MATSQQTWVWPWKRKVYQNRIESIWECYITHSRKTSCTSSELWGSGFCGISFCFAPSTLDSESEITANKTKVITSETDPEREKEVTLAIKWILIWYPRVKRCHRYSWKELLKYQRKVHLPIQECTSTDKHYSICSFLYQTMPWKTTWFFSVFWLRLADRPGVSALNLLLPL